MTVFTIFKIGLALALAWAIGPLLLAVALGGSAFLIIFAGLLISDACKARRRK